VRGPEGIQLFGGCEQIFRWPAARKPPDSKVPGQTVSEKNWKLFQGLSKAARGPLPQVKFFGQFFLLRSQKTGGIKKEK
jgi:hypothetical protein